MEHCGGDEHRTKYVHIILFFSVVLWFIQLNSVHSPPLLFLRFLDLIYFWIVSTTAPTSSYSVLSSFCLQRGYFQVEHCGGGEHEKQYVHSTPLFLLSLICFFHLNSVHSHSRCFFFTISRFYLFLDCAHHGTDILLQRSDMLLFSTRMFPSGTLRR